MWLNMCIVYHTGDRWVGEGKPKALARRQQYIENRLPEMLATWFRLSRIYSGKGMVKRIMRRQMDPNSLTPELIFQKRVHREYYGGGGSGWMSVVLIGHFTEA